MTEQHSKSKVAVLIASTLYEERLRQTIEILESFEIEVVKRGLSAHRTPELIGEFARGARTDGYSAIICGASQAAHVAGAVAAQTTVPVIGVPLSGGALGGVDALHSTVQMPDGFPVATVRVDGALNAGLLAAQIVATHDHQVAQHLELYRARIHDRGAEIDAQFIR